MSKSKIIMAILIIFLMPFIFSHYMILWSNVSLPIAEASNLSAITTLSIINVLAVIILSCMLAFPLNYIFNSYSYLIALFASIAIISWQLFIFLPSGIGTLNAINYAEWLSLLFCMPLIVFYINKLRNLLHNKSLNQDAH